MQKSDSIKNIAKALSIFQSEVKNPANTADNPFFKSKYAPLNDILNDVRPLLSKHGLSVLQSPSGDGGNIIITTLIMHESGEWIETEPLVLKADKPTAQGAGSCITYGRRYALSAVLGISSEDDDDGNEASKPNKSKGIDKSKPADAPKNETPKSDPPAQPKGNETCTDPQRKKIFAITKTLGLESETVKQMLADKCSVNSSKDLTKKQASDFIAWLSKLENGEEVWTPPNAVPFTESEIPAFNSKSA